MDDVSRATYDGEDVVLDEIFLQVEHIALLGTGGDGLCLDSGEILISHATALAKVGTEGDDLIALVCKPAELRRGVETARVRQDETLVRALRALEDRNVSHAALLHHRSRRAL
jgi:hypothetical protein